MFPYTFEAVTALTITVIGIILILYFIVLKRKGWLKEERTPQSFYLCPNPECRKVFEKPVTLTDLSGTHARLYSGCPHCGFDLKGASPSRTTEKPEMAVKIPPSPEKPRITIGELLSMKKQGRLEELGVPVKTSETATSVELRERPKTPAVGTEVPRPVERFLEEPQEEEPQEEEPQEEPAESVEAPEISRDIQPPTTLAEGLEASPPGCSHFFGYLKKIPKNAPIPDECLGCPRIVECLHSSVFSE